MSICSFTRFCLITLQSGYINLYFLYISLHLHTTLSVLIYTNLMGVSVILLLSPQHCYEKKIKHIVKFFFLNMQWIWVVAIWAFCPSCFITCLSIPLSIIQSIIFHNIFRRKLNTSVYFTHKRVSMHIISENSYLLHILR